MMSPDRSIDDFAAPSGGVSVRLNPVPWRSRLAFGLMAASIVLAGQIRSGAYRRDLIGWDESPHFVTGVLIHDYLRSFTAATPIAFAETFYVRYPRVAIGQFPPTFHTMQALWYLAWGPGKWAGFLLIGATAATVASLLFDRLIRSVGPVASCLAFALLLNPLMVKYYSSFMAEMTLCLFSLLAVLAFSDFLGEPRPRYALAFAVWSSLAILTKATALELGLFTPLAIAISGRWRVLRSPSLWASGALVALLSAPFYLSRSFSALAIQGQESLGGLVTRAAQFTQRPSILADLIEVASPALWSIAALGALVVLASGPRGPAAGPGRRDVAASVAWILAVIVFQTLSPIREMRYLLPILLPLTILAAHGLDAVQRRLARYGRPVATTATAALGSVAMILHPCGIDPCISGYAEAAEAIPSPPGGRVVLVSSDRDGEAAFVVERLVRDRDRSGVVIRSSKSLWGGTWHERYHLNKRSAEEVRAFLREVPVHYIVLDDFRCGSRDDMPHHELLRAVVAGDPGGFPLVGEFPVLQDGRPSGRSIAVYENRADRGRDFRVIRVDMTDRPLGRVLELRNPRSRSGPE